MRIDNKKSLREEADEAAGAAHRESGRSLDRIGSEEVSCS